jgi:hypothetical protein
MYNVPTTPIRNHTLGSIIEVFFCVPNWSLTHTDRRDQEMIKRMLISGVRDNAYDHQDHFNNSMRMNG